MSKITHIIMIFTDEEAIALVKELSNKTPEFIITARENSKLYAALVNGDNFCDVLIEQIEFIESANKAKARKKYSKDIRDLFERVMKPRENVFQSNGGSEKLIMQNENIRKIFTTVQSSFKANKSVFKYLSDVYFKLCDVDPNGLIFLEYKNGKSLYPTYKATKDILDYEADGQKLEYVVFTPTTIEGTGNTKIELYRIVDDVTDRVISKIADTYSIYKTFEHPFGETPGLVLSDNEKIGTKIRITQIEKIIELAKDFARDKSVLTIYKFQKGYPIHWRYVTQCRTCTGIGKKGDAKCDTCNGHGYIKNTDVTDMVTLPIPEEGQPKIAPDLAGYVSPDLETWKQYKEDLKDLEKVMKDTIWGTHLYSNSNKQLTETETATGRYIDVQPIINVLNVYADAVEYVDNTLCNWILNFIDPVKNKQERLYYKTYGRRFIIENPDVILMKYQEAKKSSDSSTVLDKLLEEFILSKYKNDPMMQNMMLKKKDIEPYVHLSFDQVNTAFGPAEAHKKELFNAFWNEADAFKPKETLKTEFEQFVKDNTVEFPTAVDKQVNNN